jgi:hypothetical protein
LKSQAQNENENAWALVTLGRVTQDAVQSKKCKWPERLGAIGWQQFSMNRILHGGSINSTFKCVIGTFISIN